jgi:hypothetical protein
MLETMDVIVREEHKPDHPQQVLPDWNRPRPPAYPVLL